MKRNIYITKTLSQRKDYLYKNIEENTSLLIKALKKFSAEFREMNCFTDLAPQLQRFPESFKEFVFTLKVTIIKSLLEQLC